MIVIPVCLRCRHLEPGMRCSAFPGGIPREIGMEGHGHTEPFPGDHGIRFEPIPTADAVRTLKPAKIDKSGRIDLDDPATRTFVAGLVSRLKAQFGITYRGKPDA